MSIEPDENGEYPVAETYAELVEIVAEAISLPGNVAEYEVYAFPDIGEIWVRFHDKAFKMDICEAPLEDFERIVDEIEGD